MMSISFKKTKNNHRFAFKNVFKENMFAKLFFIFTAVEFLEFGKRTASFSVHL